MNEESWNEEGQLLSREVISCRLMGGKLSADKLMRGAVGWGRVRGDAGHRHGNEGWTIGMVMDMDRTTTTKIGTDNAELLASWDQGVWAGRMGEMRRFRKITRPFMDLWGAFRGEIIRKLGQVIWPTIFSEDRNHQFYWWVSHDGNSKLSLTVLFPIPNTHFSRFCALFLVLKVDEYRIHSPIHTNWYPYDDHLHGSRRHRQTDRTENSTVN